MPKFVIEPTYNGGYVFKLLTDEGKTIIYSENYSNLKAASRGLDTVRSIVALEDTFANLTSAGGKPYFLLKYNCIRMATGAMHESTAERDNAIAAVKKYAPYAEVEIYEVVNT